MTLQNTKLGCTKSVTNSNYIQANDCTGLEETAAVVVSAFPNPSDGQVTVTAEGSLITAMQVFDHAGRLVYAEDNLHTELVEPDLKALADGVYTIVVTTLVSTERIPLVIKK